VTLKLAVSRNRPPVPYWANFSCQSCAFAVARYVHDKMFSRFDVGEYWIESVGERVIGMEP